MHRARHAARGRPTPRFWRDCGDRPPCGSLEHFPARKRLLGVRRLLPPSRWRTTGGSWSLQATELVEHAQLSMGTVPRPDPAETRLYLTLLGGWSASAQSGSALVLSGRKPQALLA